MSRARVLAFQAGLFVLVLVVVVALGWGGQRNHWLGLDWPVIAALGPLALSVLGPALSAWNRVDSYPSRRSS